MGAEFYHYLNVYRQGLYFAESVLPTVTQSVVLLELDAPPPPPPPHTHTHTQAEGGGGGR